MPKRESSPYGSLRSQGRLVGTRAYENFMCDNLTDTTSRSRDAMRPSCAFTFRPLGGRGECRVPAAPAVSCALCIGRTHTSNNEYTGTPGIPARNGFTAYVVLSPVTGLFCHRHQRKCFV